VAYHIQLHETIVAPYLDGLDLSLAGRNGLVRVLNELATYADSFIREPERRLTPGSDMFEVRWIFRDPTTNAMHALRFVISDAAAAYGVLRIEYVDEETAIYPTAVSS
jgi:hypothetical protein